MRIDAHQHFWRLDRGDYGWLKPSMKTLYRDFLPDDLLPLLKRCGIDGTVVVQAAPTVAETEFLLQLAELTPFIVGVVGWLDLGSERFLQDFQRLRRNRMFVGIRPMLQDLPEDDWILQETVVRNICVLADEGFPLDLLIFPRHLPYILELLRQVPHLRAVVDHLAKPHIKDQIYEPWCSQMSEIANYPNVYCKVSGMVTEADPDSWTPADLKPYVECVVKAFGAKRLLFGSDWPVCTTVASYEKVYETTLSLLTSVLSPEQVDWVFGENAGAFYRLETVR
ncbi:amidohydrolase family protein [Alicyclobacillus herbarius]|uniref:amidohydrolase family protein n=1 Tax=Alicyclobacillus herbarius TaxID=122960 RepID=UPI000406D086|nr:amidohydrolase family protein [Alicyclobacillus herbarius]